MRVDVIALIKKIVTCNFFIWGQNGSLQTGQFKLECYMAGSQAESHIPF